MDRWISWANWARYLFFIYKLVHFVVGTEIEILLYLMFISIIPLIKTLWFVDHGTYHVLPSNKVFTGICWWHLLSVFLFGLALVGSWWLLRRCWHKGRQTCWWNNCRGTHRNCWSLIQWYCIQLVVVFCFWCYHWKLSLKLQFSVCVSRVNQFCFDNQTFFARNTSGFVEHPKSDLVALPILSYWQIILFFLILYFVLLIYFREFQIHCPNSSCVTCA